MDADFQYRSQLGNRHELVWGGEIRTFADRMTGRLNATYVPQRRRDLLVSGFLQDDISIVPGKLNLVMGTKLERNSYMSAPEWQPGVKLMWTPNTVHSLWTSVARAVRAPTRSDLDLLVAMDAFEVPGNVWVTPMVLPSTFQAETLVAYELGYRFRRTRTSFDISGFINDYHKLPSFAAGAISLEPLAGVEPPIAPFQIANNSYGLGKGFEVSAGHELSESVRLLSTYSHMSLRLHKVPESTDQVFTQAEGEVPRHQGRLTCYWNLTRGITWDSSLFLVDRLPAQQAAGYASLNTHLGWQLRHGLLAGLTVDNLLSRRHFEFKPIDLGGRGSDAFGRSIRVNVTWGF